jgi:hypothetical protein
MATIFATKMVVVLIVIFVTLISEVEHSASTTSLDDFLMYALEK